MQNSKPTNINGIVTNFLSISVILLVGEVVFRYGIMAIFVVVAASITAFIISYFVRDALEKVGLMNESNRVISIIRHLWNFEFQFLNIFSAMIIFQIVLRFDSLHILFLIGLIIVALLLYEKYEGTDVNFVLISILATVLPIFVYIQKGVESVYHKLLYYHPRILLFDGSTLFKIFIITFIIFFVKMLVPKQFVASKRNGRFSKHLLAIFIIIAFVISFSTLNIVTVTENIAFENINELPLLLIRKLSPSVFYSFILAIATLSIVIVLVNYIRKLVMLKKENHIPFFIVLIVLPNLVIVSAFYEKFSILYFYVASSVTIASFTLVYMMFCVLKQLRKKMNNKKVNTDKR